MPKPKVDQLAVLTAQLSQLSCFAHIKSISLIEQGDSHQCFKVVDIHNSFFVKYFKNSNQSHHQNKLNKLAANSGLSPDLIYSDKFWQVHQFIEGTSLNLCQLPLNEKIQHGIKLMVGCHQSIDINKLTDFPILNITKIIKPLTINLTTEQKSIISKISDKLSNIMVITPQVLCHGDINFSNIILANEPWLVDFECACVAEQEFDIAMMISVNELLTGSMTTVIDFCVDYYTVISESQGKVDKEKVMRYLYFSFVINGLWYLARYRENKDKSFKYKAFKQFELFDKCHFITKNLTAEMSRSA
jgi:thiamine kinase-like enzyme